jgi:hypothetical protein
MPDFRKFIIKHTVTESSYTKPESLFRVFQKTFIYLNSVKAHVEMCPAILRAALRSDYHKLYTQMDSGEFGVHLLEDLEKSLSPNDCTNLRNMYVGTTSSSILCLQCLKQQLV